MDIALVTEGTYPYHLGGVSVWCDQLIRGLPEHRFHVHSIVGSGLEKTTYDFPDNLVGLSPIPLWAPPPQRRPARAGGHLHARFAEAHWEFLRTLVIPTATDAATFLEAMHGMFQYAQQADLGAALMSDDSIARLSSAWRMSRLADGRPLAKGTLAPPLPSLADVVTAADLMEHFLRPLSYPPPNADVCHAIMNGPSILVALAAKWSSGTPYILSEHGVYLRERYLGYANSPYSLPVKALLLRFFHLLSAVGYGTADLITPVAHYNQRWETRNGAATARISTIYNGIDPATFPPASNDPEVPTITWVGRVDPLKDLATLILAFRRVLDELPTARLRLFGPTPAGNSEYRRHCEALVKDLRLEGAATFEGPVRPVVTAYHAGHVVALTSISEAFPYTVIEAMATGRPTVSTDVGGVREAVGDTGIVVPPRNPDSAAEGCLRLLRDASLRATLGTAARDRALGSFTLERFLGIYREVYDNVALLRPMAEPFYPQQSASGTAYA